VPEFHQDHPRKRDRVIEGGLVVELAKGNPMPAAWVAAGASERIARLCAILTGAAFLAWPALLNVYPIIFVDTTHYVLQGRSGEVPWDKTAAYGLFLDLLARSISLWLPVIGQVVMLSHLLWLVQRVCCGAVTPLRHLLLAGALALLTSAPWFASALMPDHFTSILVLGFYLLAFGDRRLASWEWPWIAALSALAAAVHLSHIPLGLGLLVLVMLLRRQLQPVLRCAAPLLAALLFILGTNWITLGRVTLSPYGSVFLLARLQEDGSAVRLLRDRCPNVGWYLCDFMDALPMDTDRFLWSPDSPPNRDAAGQPRQDGNIRLAPEAAEVVAATLRAYPLEVLRDGLANGVEQLFRTRLRDTCSSADLQGFAEAALNEDFPSRERKAFLASGQMRHGMAQLPLGWVHQPVLLVAALIILGGWWRMAKSPPSERNPQRLGLVLFVLAGVTGNAFSTGPLSKPHDRYQSRIAWLLPLGAILVLTPRASLPARPRGPHAIATA